MDWKTAKTALFDELEKISGMSLSGLSAETVLSQKAPEPMQTAGLQKAMAVLDRMEMNKTAAARRVKAPPQYYMQNLHTLGTKEEEPKGVEKAKKIGVHGLAGAGAGKFIGEIATKSPWAQSWAGKDPSKFIQRSNKLNNMTWGSTVAGLAGGLANYAHKEHKKKQQAQQAVKTASTPALQLKASQQVGKVDQKISAGPGIKTQIRGSLIGRKGALP